MNQSKNIKRAHRVSLISLIVIAIFFSVTSLLFNGIAEGIEDTLYSIGIIILSVIIYVIPINEYLKGYLFGILPVLVATALFLLSGYSQEKHYLFFAAIAIVTLYFNVKLIIYHSMLTNICLVLIFIVDANSLFSLYPSFSSLIAILVMLNGAYLLLFFSNKWGNESLNLANEKEIGLKQAMDSLSYTLGELDSGTKVLDENMTVISDNAQDTMTASKEVAIAIEEVALGVQSQADTLNNINSQVFDISKNVGDAHIISNQLTESNAAMMERIASGEEQVSVMQDQMDTINEAIHVAVTTVQDLEKNMNNIQDFLGVITNISSQTNLLALNASIESARAGEAGKGFAVVADEIRKLAEQTALSVQDINSIVEVITQKTQETIQTVDKGNTAIEEGTNIIAGISQTYTTMKDSFEKNNLQLSEEINLIQKINHAFEEVNNGITDIASISEENSASSEEILSTVENQTTNIDQLSDSIKDIYNISKRLTNVIEEHNITNN